MSIQSFFNSLKKKKESQKPIELTPTIQEPNLTIIVEKGDVSFDEDIEAGINYWAEKLTNAVLELSGGDDADALFILDEIFERALEKI